MVLEALRDGGAKVGEEQVVDPGSDGVLRLGSAPRETIVLDRDDVLNFLPGDAHVAFSEGERIRAVSVRSGDDRVEPALIHIDSDDMHAWHPIRALSELPLPEDRRPRLLVALHGPISSTVGTFGQLALTPWGRKLLGNWRAWYDAVIGFDHDTVARDPFENARDLLALLDDSRHSPVLDIVAHSRGGLVLQALSALLADTAQGPELRLGTLIASPNEGTPLAESSRRLELAAILANLSGTTASGLACIGSDLGAGFVARAGLSGLGGLIHGGAGGRVTPGLDAMCQESSFLEELSERRRAGRQPRLGVFTAITGASTPGWSSDQHAPREMPASLARDLSQRAVELTGGAGDLVVPLTSMARMDPRSEVPMIDVYAFGSTPVVHHLNYLTRPEVVIALDRWHGAESTVSSPGTTVGMALSAQVNDRITVIRADEPADEVATRIASEASDYVVVRGLSKSTYSVYSAEAAMAELVEAVPSEQPADTVLRPAAAAETVSANAAASDAPPPEEAVVAVADGEPVGVVEPASASDALELGAATKSRGVESPRPTRRSTPQARPSPDGGITVRAQTEVDRVIRLGEVTQVYVDIALEDLPPTSEGKVSDSGTAIFARRPIAVELRPIDKVETVGTAHVEVDAPTADRPVPLIFKIRATEVGEAELWIILRQGVLPAITLKLLPSVEREAPAPLRLRAVAVTSGRVDADQGTSVHLVEITDYGDKTLRFRLTPDPSGIFRDYEKEVPSRADREAYVNGIYRRIESYWAQSEGDAEAFQESLQEYGGELCNELLPEALQEVLWDNRDWLEGALMLSGEPFIPWELVHLKPPGGPLPAEPCFLGQFGLVRWLWNRPHPPPELVVRKGRSRYIIPRYADPELDLPGTGAERDFLQDEFEAEPILPDLKAVKGFLKQSAPVDLLHFAGHGFAQDGDLSAALVLRGRQQRQGGKPVYTKEFLEARSVESWSRLQGEDGKRPFVVLNACQTGRLAQRLTSIGGFAEAFVTAGAGAFIASLWSVGDEPAACFTGALYKHLLSGRPMAEAVRDARADARAAGDGTWLAYAVYALPGAVLIRN